MSLGLVAFSLTMFSAKGAEATVIDTEKKLGNLHVHVVKVTRGNFSLARLSGPTLVSPIERCASGSSRAI